MHGRPYDMTNHPLSSKYGARRCKVDVNVAGGSQAILYRRLVGYWRINRKEEGTRGAIHSRTVPILSHNSTHRATMSTSARRRLLRDFKRLVILCLWSLETPQSFFGEGEIGGIRNRLFCHHQIFRPSVELMLTGTMLEVLM